MKHFNMIQKKSYKSFFATNHRSKYNNLHRYYYLYDYVDQTTDNLFNYLIQ